MDRQLAVDALDLAGDRAVGAVQRLGHAPVAPALGHEFQHLEFTRREQALVAGFFVRPVEPVRRQGRLLDVAQNLPRRARGRPHVAALDRRHQVGQVQLVGLGKEPRRGVRGHGGAQGRCVVQFRNGTQLGASFGHVNARSVDQR
ncbi:hypothetical protein D9M68_809030 [compost metagenome]